jgi:hypothetical protein
MKETVLDVFCLSLPMWIHYLCIDNDIFFLYPVKFKKLYYLFKSNKNLKTAEKNNIQTRIVFGEDFKRIKNQKQTSVFRVVTVVWQPHQLVRTAKKSDDFLFKTHPQSFCCGSKVDRPLC